MPFIDATGQRLLRAVPRLGRAERWLAALGHGVLPAAVVLLIGSGALLALGVTSADGLRADTLRAAHGAGALLLAVPLGYHGAVSGVGWVWRRLTGRPSTRPWRGLRATPEALVLTGWWLCLAVLGLSGVARYALTRLGWTPPSGGEPAVWGVIHATAVPYAYGFLLLLVYLRLRHLLPALRAYLVRQY